MKPKRNRHENEYSPTGRSPCLSGIGILLAVTGLAWQIAMLPPATVSAQSPTPTPMPGRNNLNEEALIPGALPVPKYIQNSAIRFESVSLEQGLSQSTVHCILQDSYGFMWFGTWDGLNKYDGHDFTVYKNYPDDPTSLSDNAVRSIFEDADGTLWVGTNDGGLNRLDRKTGRFTRYQHDPNDPAGIGNDTVRAILQDETGALWVGTDGGGLNKFNPQTQTFIRYQHNPDNPESLSNNSVKTIYRDQSGILWIGTGSGGLNRFNPQTKTFTRFQHNPGNPRSLSHGSILSIFQDSTGTMWIGTGSGLDAFDSESQTFTHYRHQSTEPDSLSGNTVWAIFEDRANRLWIGTEDGGLNILDRASGTFNHQQHIAGNGDSLSSNSIRSVYQDQSGVLWIGTSGGGLNKTYLDRKNFVHFHHDPTDPNSLSDQGVFPIFEDSAGNLWIGTAEGGLNRFNRQSGNFTHYQYRQNNPDSLSDNRVWSILEDSTGAMWIGTGSGLDKFNPEAQTFTHYRANPNNPKSLSDNNVFVIFEDRAGVLWIGTSGGGLNRFDRTTQQFTRYRNAPDDPASLSHNSIQAITQDHQGTLWIGTNDGLNKFDPQIEDFTVYRRDPQLPGSLSDNFILSIYEDSANRLWIGTNGGGINRFDSETETFAHYTEQDGLPNNVVYGILEDDLGNLWLSTNRGLSKFDPEAETFHNYDEKDGLQSNEFNGGSSFKSRSGELFFGGINGFNAFYPDQIEDNPYIPPVMLTSLTQSGESVPPDTSIETLQAVTLHWPNNFFEFEFAVLSYIQPEENQYAYTLDGFDSEWNYPGTQRSGRYTNLPAGTYTLKLKGANNDGAWNETGAAVTISVVPPFWQTWWFRGLGALALGAVVLGGYRLRVTSIQNQNRELEAQVRERTFEIERRRQVAEGLREILIILNSNRSPEESLNYIVSQAVRLTAAENAIVFQCGNEGGDGNVITLIAGQMPHQADGDLPAQISTWFKETILTGQTLIVTNLETYRAEHPRLTPSALNGYQALLGIPFAVNQVIYGGLALFYAQPRTFSDDTLQLGYTFADQATLAIANAQLRNQAEQTAVEMERNRLARDLHDAVTQTLFSASLIAEALPTIWEVDQAEGKELLKEMRRLSRGALAEMRTLLLELRPTVLVEAKLGDLLRQLTEAVTGRKDITATVTIEDQCTLPSDVHVALYRIAQEALNNVVKHAHANHVTINLRDDFEAETGKIVVLLVQDNGVGFDPTCVPPDHLGLGIIRERAQAIGADLTITSRPGSGTQIRVVWKETPQGEKGETYERI